MDLNKANYNFLMDIERFRHEMMRYSNYDSSAMMAYLATHHCAGENKKARKKDVLILMGAIPRDVESIPDNQVVFLTPANYRTLAFRLKHKPFYLMAEEMEKENTTP